jgi:1-acyl-sn-glycerol-3-phosphate acyltransferase
MMNGHNPYQLLRKVFGPIARGIWLSEIRGLEHIPETGPAILVSNHCSYLDFLLLTAACERHITYVVGECFNRKPLIRRAMQSMEFIFIDRLDPYPVTPVRHSLRVLEQGRLLGIYPEGTRSRDGKLQRARDGVGYLAMVSGVPVVPIFMHGTYSAWPRHRRLPRYHPCEISIGESVLFGRTLHPSREQCQVAARRIMQAVAHLGGEEYPW